MNIAHHLKESNLRILDIGGGNGLDSIYYAQRGHAVTLFDVSAAMLDEARINAGELGVSQHLTMIQEDISHIRRLLGVQRFNLILFHLVLEFLPDPPAFLGEVVQLLASGGLLSVIDPNRYSFAYIHAFYRGNIAEAINSIGIRQYFNPWVNRLTPLYSAEEIIDILEERGCTISGRYGIHNVFYYLPDERKSDLQSVAELEQLEHHLTDVYPYYQLARFYQVIARRKPGNDI